MSLEAKMKDVATTLRIDRIEMPLLAVKSETVSPVITAAPTTSV
jgi:hypothetical protein